MHVRVRVKNECISFKKRTATCFVTNVQDTQRATIYRLRHITSPACLSSSIGRAIIIIIIIISPSCSVPNSRRRCTRGSSDTGPRSGRTGRAPHTQTHTRRRTGGEGTGTSTLANLLHMRVFVYATSAMVRWMDG